MDILAVNWNVSPEIFRIGSFAVRWYGLLFVSGFILGYWMFTKFFEREKVDKNLLDPLLYTLLLGTLVGARLGHCIFYQPDYYFGSWKGFLEVFMVWKGGLASHGGTIMLLFCMIWFARKYGRKNDFNVVWLLDHLCIAVAFAGAAIRLGNLFNSEIYGDVTNLPWGFIFERRGETLAKHPTQIYEALSYFILGLGLVWLYVKKLDKVYRGTFIGIFFIVCFGMRFIIEFIKEPQVEFEETMALDMGQILSIPFIILGIFFLIYAYRRKLPAAAVHPVVEKKPSEPTHYAKSLSK
jgi:prolipoprotein diacylglyceryl transferase